MNRDEVVEGSGRQGRRGLWSSRATSSWRVSMQEAGAACWWLGDAVKGNGMRSSDGGWRSFDGNREQREIGSKEEVRQIRSDPSKLKLKC